MGMDSGGLVEFGSTTLGSCENTKNLKYNARKNRNFLSKNHTYIMKNITEV